MESCDRAEDRAIRAMEPLSEFGDVFWKWRVLIRRIIGDLGDEERRRRAVIVRRREERERGIEGILGLRERGIGEFRPERVGLRIAGEKDLV